MGRLTPLRMVLRFWRTELRARLCIRRRRLQQLRSRRGVRRFFAVWTSLRKLRLGILWNVRRVEQLLGLWAGVFRPDPGEHEFHGTGG